MTPHIDAVRRFNRFYTRRIGALDREFLDSPFSLTEVRVLYELAQREHASASELCQLLGLDRGYVSRMLKGFRRRGLVRTEPSPGDARSHRIALTEAGRRRFGPIEARQRTQVARLLESLPKRERERLLAHMEAIQALLEPRPRGCAPVERPIALRSLRAGDLGWIVHRQALLYQEEYGWNQRYEALIARVMGDFVDHFDPERERCWVAERDGEILGCIFCVRKSRTVAKLRLLYVEPAARGAGLGSRLVAECIAFARSRGYRTLTLWTNSVLAAARRIYERAGFRRVDEESHALFGRKLVGETWELRLR